MCFGGVIGAIILLTHLNYPIFNNLIGRGILCFSIGVGLVKIYEEREKFNSRLLGYICMIALVAIYLGYRIKGSEILGNLQMAFILGIGPMIILSAILVPWLNKLLSLKSIVYIGTLSIDIYLFHFPVQCLIGIIDKYANLQLNYSWKVWVVYVAVTLIVSVLYKSFISRKYEKILKRVIFHLSA